MEFKHLSASSIDGFTVCPRRQYMTMTADKKDRVPQGFLIVGNAAHEALRKYHTDLEDKRDLVELFKDEIKTMGFVPFPVFASAAEFMSIYEKNNPRKQNIVFTEKSFLVDMAGYPVRGFIDRVDYHGDGVYEIVDYKTSWVAKSADDLKEDIQLITYDIALRIMAESGEVMLPAPIKRVIVSLYYLRHDKVSAEYTEEQRQGYLEYVSMVGDAVKAIEEEPQPKLNNFCRYCDFSASCSLYNSDFA
jgi:RecB family exonuclease